MEFRDTPGEAAFRQQVREFIAQNLPQSAENAFGDGLWRLPATPAQREFYDRWRNALAGRGWIAPHWPREYGGAGMSPGEQFIFNEELAKVRAPMVGGLGVTHI